MVGGVKAATGTCDTSLPLSDEDNACRAKVTSTEGKESYFLKVKEAYDFVLTNGGTLDLGTDIKITKADLTYIDTNIVINAYDHFIEIGPKADSFEIARGGSLTINGIGEDSASISSDQTNKPVFVVDNGGKLVINGIDLEADSLVDGQSAIKTNGTVDIANANIFANTAYLIDAGQDAIVNLDATIDYDGEGEEAAKGIVTVSEAAAYGHNPAKITINGGNYNVSNIAFDLKNGASLIVNGGNVRTPSNVVKISGTTGANVSIIDGTLISDSAYTILVSDSSKTTSLNIAGGKIVSLGNNRNALYLKNAAGKYSITNGLLESTQPEGTAAILLGDDFFDEEGNVIPSQQGIVTGGSYLNKIVAAHLTDDGATVDVSAQLVKAGVKIETKDGYVVVGEGKSAEQTEEPTAPESQEAIGNTADAKNPGTSDNFMSLVSLVSASAAGLFIAFKKARLFVEISDIITSRK